MPGMNRVIIQGNLGRDPEIRTTNGGTRIATLSIATSDTWRDRTTGERREQTEWHRVVIFNSSSGSGDGMVGVCEKYLRKGSPVLIEGKLQTRKWTDNSGQDRYTTEIVVNPFGGSLTLINSGNRQGGGQGNGQGYGGTGSLRDQPATATGGGAGRDYADLNDDIPF